MGLQMERRRPGEGEERADAAKPKSRAASSATVPPRQRRPAITRPTASCKTALLMALPDEPTLQPASGRIIMSKNLSKVNAHELMHAISYSAQSPWLRPQSIKDNILFGFPYDGERYNAVVECCALQTDLSIFEDGDDTEIGARGLSLSGGQKTRVALARAVYTRTKYVLLDDPLSAVDSHTSRFQFEKLLRALWLANRIFWSRTTSSSRCPALTTWSGCSRIDTRGIVEELRSRVSSMI